MSSNKVKKIEEKLNKTSEDIAQLQSQIELISDNLNIDLSKNHQVGPLYNQVDYIAKFFKRNLRVVLSILLILYTVMFCIGIYKKNIDYTTTYIYIICVLSLTVLLVILNDKYYFKLLTFCRKNKILNWRKKRPLSNKFPNFLKTISLIYVFVLSFKSVITETSSIIYYALKFCLFNFKYSNQSLLINIFCIIFFGLYYSAMKKLASLLQLSDNKWLRYQSSTIFFYSTVVFSFSIFILEIENLITKSRRYESIYWLLMIFYIAAIGIEIIWVEYKIDSKKI